MLLLSPAPGNCSCTPVSSLKASNVKDTIWPRAPAMSALLAGRRLSCCCSEGLLGTGSMGWGGSIEVRCGLLGVLCCRGPGVGCTLSLLMLSMPMTQSRQRLLGMSLVVHYG